MTKLQSHHVHATVLTIIQQPCSMKQKHTKYTEINTNKSMQSEMGPVWQNPIRRTVSTAHSTSVHNTTQNSPSYLQKKRIPALHIMQVITKISLI